MARVPKPALSVFAALILVVAAACRGGSAAPTAGGANGPAGATNIGAAGATSGAPGATVQVAGATAVAANPNDPNSIISQVISGGSDLKSFHIKIAVSGTIKAAALKAASASSGLKVTSDVTLDGTAIEGDVDVANQAAHLSLSVPALAMLGNVPITGDLILVDNALYYKVSLLGPKYTKTNLGSLTSGLPVSIPTPGASAMTSVTDEVTQIRAAMQKAGVTATLVGVDQIGGKDAYHINISVPIDKLNAEIAAQASGGPAMKLDSASVDLWVYKDSSRLAKFEIQGASSSLGNIDFTVTITNYDQAVTVTAPPASEVKAGK